MPHVEVRPYAARDRDELIGLFGAAGQGAPGSQTWGDVKALADVYLTAYLDLEPSSVFVAVVDGRLAGYLAGCVDDAAFPSEEERIARAIREHRTYLQPGPLRFFVRAAYDRLVLRLRNQPVAGSVQDPRWPSHLHIDLVPAGRGVGAADGLMAAWFDRLREVGSPGCYLQTSAENHRAVRFFERMGFTRHGPTPVVPGARHDGRRMHEQTMVRSLQPD